MHTASNLIELILKSQNSRGSTNQRYVVLSGKADPVSLRTGDTENLINQNRTDNRKIDREIDYVK